MRTLKCVRGVWIANGKLYKSLHDAIKALRA